MAEWFCDIMGEVVGPLKSSELVQKVRTGEVTFDTKVRKDDSQWVPAGEVNGLLDAAMKDDSRRACPYCGTTVQELPTTCSGCDRYITRSVTVSDKGKQPKQWKRGEKKKVAGISNSTGGWWRRLFRR